MSGAFVFRNVTLEQGSWAKIHVRLFTKKNDWLFILWHLYPWVTFLFPTGLTIRRWRIYDKFLWPAADTLDQWFIWTLVISPIVDTFSYRPAKVSFMCLCYCTQSTHQTDHIYQIKAVNRVTHFSLNEHRFDRRIVSKLRRFGSRTLDYFISYLPINYYILLYKHFRLHCTVHLDLNRTKIQIRYKLVYSSDFMYYRYSKGVKDSWLLVLA